MIIFSYAILLSKSAPVFRFFWGGGPCTSTYEYYHVTRQSITDESGIPKNES